MLTEELKKAGRECLGCGACETICAVHAVKVDLQADEEKVISIDKKKCRDCFLCEIVCPQLHARKDNLEEPECKVINRLPANKTGNDLFKSMAVEVFSHGGIVCGPAWREDFREIAYTIASNEDELKNVLWQNPFHVQSHDIYKVIERQLKKGVPVFFFGQPCQVAALRNVIDGDSDNLLTVSFPCQGIVQPGIFRKHIEEIADGRVIKNIRFGITENTENVTQAVCNGSMVLWRKWPEVLCVDFEDSTSYLGTRESDAFVRGWHENLILFKGCSDCIYARLPLQSDIVKCNVTKYSTSYSVKKMVAHFLINNPRGKNVFRKVMKKEKAVLELPEEKAELFLCHNPMPHPMQKRFLKMSEKQTLSKSITYTLQGLYDIALVGPLHWPDYGLQLSYYAMYKVLKEFGYETLLMADKRELYNATKLFASEAFPLNDMAFLDETGRQLNMKAACFMVGPGPVWDEKIMQASASGSYVLDFVDSCREKLTYGITLGDFFRTDSPGKKKWLKEMKSFAKIFVDTESDVLTLANEKIDSSKSLSPLLLCELRYLRELAEKSSVISGGKYLFSYLVNPKENGGMLEEVADSLELPLVSMAAAGVDASEWLGHYEKDRKLEDWLKYLLEAAFVITDSPQAAYLAVIFEKEFFFIQGWHNRTAEVREAASLMKNLGLGNRVVEMMSDILEELPDRALLDYTPVRMLLGKARKDSLEILHACLAKCVDLW